MSRQRRRQSGREETQSVIAACFSQNDPVTLGDGLRYIFEHHNHHALEKIAQDAGIPQEQLETLMNDSDNAAPLNNQEFTRLAKAVTKFTHK